MDVESKTRPGKTADAVPADPAIGKPLARVDGRERVTGRARYAADITRPDMAHAKILRAPHAHAVIKRIDTSAAAALPGVLAIVTADDFPDLPQGASIPMGETGYDMWGRLAAQHGARQGALDRPARRRPGRARPPYRSAGAGSDRSRIRGARRRHQHH